MEESLHQLASEIASQEEVVAERKKVTNERNEHKQQTLAAVEAIGSARGIPFLWRRKLSTRLYLTLLSFFAVADIILIATALLIIGESNEAVWLLAMSLVAALLWTTHVAGVEWNEAEEHPNNRGAQQHRRKALGATVLILVALAAIGYIRVEYFEARGVGGQLLAVYGLQLIVAGAAIAASYYHSNSFADVIDRVQEEVEDAEATEEVAQNRLADLEAQRKAKLTEKVQLVVGFLRAGEAALQYIEQLQQSYATTYERTCYAEGRAAGLTLPPIVIPGWMWEWAAWINEQTVVDRPAFGTSWTDGRELPPAAGVGA